MMTNFVLAMLLIVVILLVVQICMNRMNGPLTVVSIVLTLVVACASYFVPAAPTILFDQDETENTTMELRCDNDLCDIYYYFDNDRTTAVLYKDPVPLQGPCIVSAFCNLAFIPGPSSHREFDPAKIYVRELQLNPKKLNLTVGEQTVLEVAISPDYADNRTLIWESGNQQVATVTGQGVITAKATGSTRVTVWDESKSVADTCIVTVTSPDNRPAETPDKPEQVESVIPVESVVFTHAPDVLYQGTNILFQVQVQPLNVSNPSIEWNSSDGTVAFVDQHGLVTARNCGEATITARVGGQVASRRLVVASHPILSEKSLCLEPGEFWQLAIIQEPYPLYADIIWVSRSPHIVSVSSNGEVYANAPGECEVLAIVDGTEYSCEVLVTQPAIKPEELELYAPFLMCVGETWQGKVQIYPKEVGQAAFWESDNPSVVSVSEDGYLIARHPGQAIIYAYAQEDDRIWASQTIQVERVNNPNPIIEAVFDGGLRIGVNEHAERMFFIEAPGCDGELWMQLELLETTGINSIHDVYLVPLGPEVWVDLGFSPEEYGLIPGRRYRCIMDFYYNEISIYTHEYDIWVDEND